MSTRKPSSRGATTIELPAVMDIKAATPLHRQIVPLRGKALTLDASGVQRIGGQCLQILLAAVAAWNEDKKAITIASPSQAFEEGLALLGFTINSLTGKEATR